MQLPRTADSRRETETALAFLTGVLAEYHPRDFTIRLWNDTTWGPEEGSDARFTLILNHPGALRRMFLRAPLNYRRISSLYSPQRMHPIFRTLRPHQAIDYAAAAGTPVVSIGRGTVKFAGWQDGYGNLVEVTHGNGYTTRYAHLSRIASGLSKGTRVAQGHVIGFVGQTGHATGPHLHFEVMSGQRKINFLALRIPSQQRLSGEELERFAASRAEHLALLHNGEFLLAQSRS